MRALAQASAEERVAAEALFDEGKKLLSEGQLAPACEKLEQSQRIDSAVGTLLYLAECYEKSGRTASAWATFREASSAARASGQANRARIGQDRAARLEARLVRLTIKVDNENSAIEGFQVKRRGESVPKGVWGVPVPVDPGEQLIEASAPGYQPFSQRVSIDKQPGTATVPALIKLVSAEPRAAQPHRATAGSRNDTAPLPRRAPPAVARAGERGHHPRGDWSRRVSEPEAISAFGLDRRTTKRRIIARSAPSATTRRVPSSPNRPAAPRSCPTSPSAWAAPRSSPVAFSCSLPRRPSRVNPVSTFISYR